MFSFVEGLCCFLLATLSCSGQEHSIAFRVGTVATRERKWGKSNGISSRFDAALRCCEACERLSPNVDALLKKLDLKYVDVVPVARLLRSAHPKFGPHLLERRPCAPFRTLTPPATVVQRPLFCGKSIGCHGLKPRRVEIYLQIVKLLALQDVVGTL